MMELEGTYRYSAAELMAEVSRNLDEIRELSPWHTIIVDDAQLLDPTAGRLVQTLIDGCDLAVVGGNREHAIFHFRGASSEFLTSCRRTSRWNYETCTAARSGGL